MSDGKIWIVVHTHANSESNAVENLQRQGYRCYCPKVVKIRRHARRVDRVLRPLFPGYVFVQYDNRRQALRPVSYSRGVKAIVRFGAELGVLSSEFVDALRRSEAHGELAIPPARERFDIGQEVKLAGTPFEDLIGTIVSIDERERIWVVLDAMSRQVKARVPASEVSAA